MYSSYAHLEIVSVLKNQSTQEYKRELPVLRCKHPRCNPEVKTIWHSVNHIGQDPSFRGVPALSRALGTHLTVTHSSLDHRGQTQTLITCHFVPVMDTGAFAGWVGGLWGNGMCRQFAKAHSLELSEMSLEYDLEGVVGVFWEKSEINTELLMFVPSIDIFLCLPFTLPCICFFLSLFHWFMAEPGSPVCSKTLYLNSCNPPANPLADENLQTQDQQLVVFQVECFRVFSCWAN